MVGKGLLPRLVLALACLGPAAPARAQDKGYTRLVVFSDLHLPNRLAAEKRQAVDAVNSWPDVDGIVALGDIVADQGTKEEYDFAKTFLARLQAPLYPIAGNHEYVYDVDAAGKKKRASPAVKASKLRLFQETFSLPSLHYERKFGPYRCLFISNDALEGKFLTAMSTGTLAWLKDKLNAEAQTPTIVFFHGPLEGTLQSRNEVSANEGFMAQPKDELRAVIRDNPQVFLWVSGHTHIAPTNKRFNDEVNVYEGRVTDVFNSDMDGRSYLSDQDRATTAHDTIWTNSLFLYPDKVVVKTFDHKQGKWLDGLTREIHPNPTPRQP